MNRILLIVAISVALSSSAYGLEFVSQEKSMGLKADFGRAMPFTEKALRSVAEKDLKCDMYGVRTRLQVERGVVLYRFRLKNSTWENEGAQVVRNYRVAGTGLVGRHGGLTDTIRIVDGQLISELSIETPQSSATVLAYSVCNIRI